MTSEEMKQEGLHEAYLLPEGWTVEFGPGWPDGENGPRPDDRGYWMLKSGGIIVCDSEVGTDAGDNDDPDGLYVFLTTVGSVESEDAEQIVTYLKKTGAVI